jgi:hypothetical protein
MLYYYKLVASWMHKMTCTHVVSDVLEILVGDLHLVGFNAQVLEELQVIITHP